MTTSNEPYPQNFKQEKLNLYERVVHLDLTKKKELLIRFLLFIVHRTYIIGCLVLKRKCTV